MITINIKEWDKRHVVSLLVFVALFFLIFIRLGYYPLWDDEANTAIYAHGVWQTGDTTAVYGHNILVYGNGIELSAELKNRYVSPLQYYITAVFSGLLGEDAFSVRLPFALAGLFTFCFVIYWLFQAQVTFKTHLLTMLGFLGNVSFILYSRQCRYYALAMLFSVLVAYFYLYRNKNSLQSSGWGKTIGLALCLILLMSTHYLAYAALFTALLVDFLLWERHRFSFSQSQLVFIIMAQLVVGICIVSIWNPLDSTINQMVKSHWLLDRLMLIGININKINASEMLLGFVFFVAPLSYLLQKKRNLALLRLVVACTVLLIAACIFSPTSVDDDRVRYIAFALPAFIFLTVLTIENLPFASGYQYMIAAVIFYSTFLHGVFSYAVGGVWLPTRSTVVSYVQELWSPPDIAYSKVADWINKNTVPGQTAAVFPTYASYPLMYHAPKLIYGWQLENNMRDKFPFLPAIQYREKIMPDYIIIFGFSASDRKNLFAYLKAEYNIDYSEVARLAVSSTNMSRAEIHLHTFKQVNAVDMNSDAVAIFQVHRQRVAQQ